jgi:hypothetical protein
MQKDNCVESGVIKLNGSIYKFTHQFNKILPNKTWILSLIISVLFISIINLTLTEAKTITNIRPIAAQAPNISAQKQLAQSTLKNPTIGNVNLSITISKIGNAKVLSSGTNSQLTGKAIAYYYVNPRELITGNISGNFPSQKFSKVSLHPLVRHKGEQEWKVHKATIKLSKKGSFFDWMSEVEFGKQCDDGGIFDLRVIVSKEPLPSGFISLNTIIRNTIATSEIIKVKRRTKMSVWISHVNDIPIYGDKTPWVLNQAPVDVKAINLPPEAQIGIAVQPVKPMVDRYWVMLGSVESEKGRVFAYFGRLELNQFEEFEITAFAVYPEDFPPRGVEIPQQQWERFKDNFLAESQSVQVVKWREKFIIDKIDNKTVLPSIVVSSKEQADVSGVINRSLDEAGGEKIWIVCVPRKGNPWLAGFTGRILRDGRWVVNIAKLWKDGLPLSLNIFAVISDEDPTQKEPGELRDWLNSVEQTEYSIKVRISASSDE